MRRMILKSWQVGPAHAVFSDAIDEWLTTNAGNHDLEFFLEIEGQIPVDRSIMT